jgi:S-DNA-T family DNA segregation ATPase FtsK/SpoIIIE
MTLTVPAPTGIRRAAAMTGRVGRAAAGEVWWWLSLVGRLAGHHPWRCGGFVLVCVVLSWQGADVLLVVVVGLPLVLVVWRRFGPWSFARIVGLPWWRRRVRREVRRVWSSAMQAVGLARRPAAELLPRPGQPVLPADRVAVPKLAGLRWQRDGQLVAVPRLLVGQTVEDVEQVADRLRVVVEARRCRVVPNEMNTACRIVWSFGDPLAAPFNAAVPAVGAGLPDPRRLLMGRTEDDQPWLLDVRVSTLVAGTSGSGKASLVWSLLFGLAPAIRAGLVEVHGIDLKGGMEFGMGRPLFTRYAQTADVAVQLLEDAAAQMSARAQRLSGISRALETASTADPLVFVVVDELAALVAYQTDRDLLRRAEAALSLVLSQGRAVGFFVFGFLQDPRKDTEDAAPVPAVLRPSPPRPGGGRDGPVRRGGGCRGHLSQDSSVDAGCGFRAGGGQPAGSGAGGLRVRSDDPRLRRPVSCRQPL